MIKQWIAVLARIFGSAEKKHAVVFKPPAAENELQPILDLRLQELERLHRECLQSVYKIKAQQLTDRMDAEQRRELAVLEAGHCMALTQIDLEIAMILEQPIGRRKLYEELERLYTDRFRQVALCQDVAAIEWEIRKVTKSLDLPSS